MVTDLQFVAVAAFLIWGLAASLCGVFAADPDAARLIWRKGDSKPKASTDDVRVAPDRRQAAADFASDHKIIASARPSADPSMPAQARRATTDLERRRPTPKLS